MESSIDDDYGVGGGPTNDGGDGYVEITILDSHLLDELISESNPLYYNETNLIGLKIEPESGSNFDSSSVIVTTRSHCGTLSTDVIDYDKYSDDSYSVIYLELTDDCVDCDCEVTVSISENPYTTSDGA